jgi:hypothetical protein
MHVGEAGYYQDLRALIDRQEADQGAVVHCEGVNLGRAGDLSPDEVDLLDELRRVKDLEAVGVAALGWTGQIEALGYPPHWQVIDQNLMEIIREVGHDTFLRRSRLMVWVLHHHRHHPAKARAWFQAQAVIVLRAAAFGLLTRQRSDTVIVDQRTTVALNGLDCTTRNTVMVWGAFHLPGLDAGIRQRGFTRVATDWHTVTRLPTLRAALWHAIRGGRTRIRRDADADTTGSQTGPGDTIQTPLQSSSGKR